MRLTDEQCEALILEDCNMTFVRFVAIFQISARRYQVIGTNEITPGGWASNDGRPIDNFMRWNPVSKPLDHHDAMQVLSYMEDMLRTRRGVPLTPAVCPSDNRSGFSQGISLPPKK